MEYYRPVPMVTKDNWDITKIILFILVLALFGINVFQYLSKTTDLLAYLGIKGTSSTIRTTKNIIEHSKQGAKVGVDLVGGTLERGLTTLEDVVLNKPQLQTIHGRQIPKPDISSSGIQYPKKSGYCYIGKENNNRACVKVGINDVCMSGEIFPSRDICMNPNLRV